MNPLDFTAGPFLALYVAVAALAWLIAASISRNIGPGGGTSASLSTIQMAYLAGGEGRLAHALLVSLLTSKAAVLLQKGRLIFVDRSRLQAAPEHADVAPLGLSGEMTRNEFQMRIQPMADAVRADLQRLGLVPDPSMLPSYRLKILAVFAVPIILGLAKVDVGLARDKPVGFLIALLIATAVLALVYLTAPRLTRAGRDALEASRRQHARAARAPVESELPLAVALTGLVVLSGTDYGDLHASEASGGGDGAADGGGDGGGGCGGGCGGCGGGS